MDSYAFLFLTALSFTVSGYMIRWGVADGIMRQQIRSGRRMYSGRDAKIFGWVVSHGR